ncbi:hypothetical protein [Chryseobacterium sp. EZn1]|uniref:hypothetical protein n=1 Tax=Chryseobacterium cupriresistens TaxID=3366770 RepID=UPI003984D1A6
MSTIKALKVPKIQDISSPSQIIKAIPPLGLPPKKTGKYSEDFYGLERNEKIDFSKIVKYLKTGTEKPLDWTNFIAPTKIINESVVIGTDGVVDVKRKVNETIPFSYINSYKQKITTSISCGINRKIDNIDSTISISFQIDSNQEQIKCKAAYFYKNTEHYRNSVQSTTSENAFSINDKYVGIMFFSENITDIYYLIKEIQGDTPEWFQQLINNKYIPLIERTTDIKQLIWLYENAPDFTLSSLKPEVLWKNICSFYSYDVNGFFSFVRDASPALMKALFAFNTPQRISFLMQQFNKNQSFVVNLYHALDDEIAFMGQEVPCRMAFISIINSFSHIAKDNFTFTNHLFSVGKKSFVSLEKIESNLKEDKNKYYVQQKYITDEQLIDTGSVIMDIGSNTITTRAIKLNPLDIVIVIEEETQSLLFVPALFLYDKQHQKNMEGLASAIRIGINMLAIALAVETLGTSLLAAEGASSITFWGMLVAVDGAIALGDLGIQLAKDNLTKEFLDIWEKIYKTAGYATATTAVVQQLYKIGGKILAEETRAEVKNFVMSCMVKVMLEREISNFTKNTFKVLLTNKELIDATRGLVNEAKSKMLNKYGMFLIEGQFKTQRIVKNKVVEEVNNEIAIVYKGEIITRAQKSEFYKEANKLLKHLNNPKEFIKAAEELLTYGKIYPTSNLKDLLTEAEAYNKYGDWGRSLVEKVNIDAAKILSTFDAGVIFEKTMISGFIYVKNGIRYISTETNFLKAEIGKGKGEVYKNFIDNIHPTLKIRLEKHIARLKMKGVPAEEIDILRAGAMGSHGEIRALDRLLTTIDPEGKLGEAVFHDIIGYNRYLRIADKLQPPCVHCYYLTSGIRFMGF